MTGRRSVGVSVIAAAWRFTLLRGELIRASGGTGIGQADWFKGLEGQVSDDGTIVALGIRADMGKEYEVLLSAVDSTPLVTDLLSEMVRTHRDKPPRTFAADAGPNHAKSVPVQPLRRESTGAAKDRPDP